MRYTAALGDGCVAAGDDLTVDVVTLFWALARWAVEQGLISKEAVQVIARPGKRKERYWSRHLVDLCGAIARQDNPSGDKTTS